MRASYICSVLYFCGLFCMLTPAVAQEGPVDSSDSEVAADLRIEVLANQTPVFAAPDDGATVRMKLKKGRKLLTQGGEQNGFFALASKSGAVLYVRVSDVRVLGVKAIAEDDLLSGEDAGTRRGEGARGRRRSDGEVGGGGRAEKWRLTYDLGGSFGSTGKVNYNEVDLGLNLYFTHYLALRNAVFARFVSGFDPVLGLDTSLRGILNLDLGPVGGITTFAGPGYRFVNEGNNAPLGEAGLILKLLGFAIGGGVKVILNSWAVNGAANDTQYFIILSGGGSL